MGRKFWVIGVTVLVCGAAGALLLIPGQRNVLRVTEPDPAMRDAIRTARTRLPEFNKALLNAGPKDRFSVRVKLKTEAGSEFIWLRNVYPAPNHHYLGEIAQKPVGSRATVGETTTVPEAEVVDWIMSVNGVQTGGFTDPAVGVPSKPK